MRPRRELQQFVLRTSGFICGAPVTDIRDDCAVSLLARWRWRTLPLGTAVREWLAVVGVGAHFLTSKWRARAFEVCDCMEAWVEIDATEARGTYAFLGWPVASEWLVCLQLLYPALMLVT